MAYAAIISLKRTIERLTNPPNPRITKSAYQELESLEHLLERLDESSTRCIDRSVLYVLDAKIIETVCKLEDVIECYELNLSHPASQGLGYNGVEQEIRSFLKIVKQFKWIYNRVLDRRLPREEDDEAVSPIDDFRGNKSSNRIGLSDEFEKIWNDILDPFRRCRIVSLVGMAGIGKTHLAREIYQHPTVVQHFDFTAWVSVGPKDQIEDALVDIAAQIERKPRDVYVKESKSKLIQLLLNSMNGRRYLIVLDDIWSTEVLDFLVKCDPNVGTGCLLLTTRLHHAAKIHGAITHKIRFLNNEESWDLLWQNVFADCESFPLQLEKVGRKIAEKCEGLPLLILAVASILVGEEKTEEYWMKVANKKTTTFTDAYDKIEKVLYTSYEYLPQHLKACFLYMGVFPQSSEILVSKLLYLWTIEDFLEQKGFQSLEDFAMECLEGIVSRSVVIVCKQSYNYQIKSCKLHSAYWHLCVKEARKNKFLLVLRNLIDASKECIESQRRLSVQTNILFGIKEVYDLMAATFTARSLLCTGEDHQYPVPICFNLMLLKVLDVLPIRLYEFPTEVVQLSELRYLALTHDGKLPSSISKLRKLQCLIVSRFHNIKLLRDSTSLPKETWDKQELTHPGIIGSNLQDPRYKRKLPNLLTLYVTADRCSRTVFKSIPTLKKLGIKIELQHVAKNFSCFKHIRLLHQLESLKCVVVSGQLGSQAATPPHHLANLPTSLKKLSLNGLGYSWDYMSLIGWLPKLEVLKLRCSAFRGIEWKTRVGGFKSLELLLLEDIDLVQWTIANDKSFPRLRRLIIRHCYKLEEIPRGIGGIPTLETMEVVSWRPSVLASAREIQENRSCSLHKLQCLIVRHHHNLESFKEICNMLTSAQLLRDSTCLPKEIWDVHQLRHLRIMGSNLPEPSNSAELPNLFTLYVNAHSCTEAVFRSTPCLKKLGIRIELQPNAAETLNCFQHIWLLHGLESLKCVVINPRLRSQVVAPPDDLTNFPLGLKKLNLYGLGYSWKYMGAIGTLPKLEVLKLRCYAFQGEKWEIEDREFQNLKYLLLEDIDVVHWTSDDDDCFPRLRRLTIRHCYKLKEIPSQIGGISALETVEVVDCSPSVVASAQKIQEKRNSSVEVVIKSSWKLRR